MTDYNEIKLLYRQVSLLKNQLKDAHAESRKLRKELAKLNKDSYFKVETSWAENDGKNN